MMNVPTECPRCEDVVELNTMTDLGNDLYCTECAWRLSKLEGE